MNVHKYLRDALIAALVFVGFTACSDDENVSKVEEGLPASISFTVSVPNLDDVGMSTRATAEQESSVTNMMLLFYKDNVTKPIEITVGARKTDGSTYDGTTIQAVGKSLDDSHRLYNITIPTTAGLTSGEWYVYGVANYEKQYVNVTASQLKEMTKSQADNFYTSGSHETDFVETGLLLSGKYRNADKGDEGKLTLNPGNNTLEGEPLIVLKRTLAKNVFKFKNGDGVTFTPTSYQVFNHSASSTLFERTGWESGKDATPGETLLSEDEGDKKDLDTTNEIYLNMKVGSTSEEPTDSFVFYTQENVQKAKSYSGDFSYNMREERNSTSDRTFKYAPDNGTYIVIKGNYEGPATDDNNSKYETVKGEVTYTIHLGDFSKEGANKSTSYGSYDNFTVRRNVKYTYTITVNGVNNIVVEAMTDKEGQAGAEGNLVASGTDNSVTLDAHYGQAILCLGNVSDFGDNLSSCKLIIATPKNGFSLSPAEYDFANKTSLSAYDTDWVEFAQPNNSDGTFTFKSYETFFSSAGSKKSDTESNSLCGISKLLEELKTVASGSSTDHLLVYDNKVYVAAYVDEYYYSNLELSGFVNVDNREMLLAATVYQSKDGQSTFSVQPIFSIQQQSIKCPFKTDGTLTNPFGIENEEETPATTLCQNASKVGDFDSGYEKKHGDFSGDDDFYGWDNCKSIRTSSSARVRSLIGQSWSTYVNDNYNGYILGKLANGNPSNIMNRNYAICQFLSRNRDLDGDGLIDENELRWYTPAMEQCLNLWLGMNSLPSSAILDMDAKNYLTSTAGSSRTWWIDEGVAFGYWKYDDNSNKNNVRVIRNLGKDADAYKKESSSLISYNSNTHVVSMAGLQDEVLRTYSITGNYAKHETQSTYDRLPRAFKVARQLYSYVSDNTTYSAWSPSVVTASDTIGDGYFEEEDGSDRGYWRVPNEKELGVIFQLAQAQANSSFPYGTSDLYKVGSRTVYDGTRYYWINNNSGTYFITTSADGMSSSSTDMKILLVRDVTTSSSAKSRKASAVKVKKH